MAALIKTFDLLPKTYIFPLIEEKMAAFERAHPKQELLNLGIGDVCLPLVPQVAQAISDAVFAMTKAPVGYGPETGYSFLKEAICTHEYSQYGLEPKEIIISDGANGCVTALLDLFSPQSVIAASNPSYPLYQSATLLSGRKFLSLALSEKNGFLPSPPKERADIVFLCTPGNPTGMALDKDALQVWIDWALENKAILVLDNVYNVFASSPDVPESVYALKNGEKVAIEIRSFSKMAGFTGLRCGYMVVPKQLHVPNALSHLCRQFSIKTNGVSYPIQKGAASCYEPSIRLALKNQIAIYKQSAALLSSVLKEKNQTFFGGVDGPYIFWKIPDGQDDWDFFDQLLHTANILAIPGMGFGSFGKGYIRLSAFLSNQRAIKAQNALRDFL